MIKEDKIEIKSGKYKKYYESLGYIFKDKKTIVDIKHLKPNSLIRIDVICDLCGTIKKLRYQDYMKSTDYLKSEYYCKDCKSYKYKKTCIEKYEVSNVSKLDIIKRKKINTCIKNYGVDNPSKSDIIKKKKEETSLIRYGKKYPNQVKKVFNERINNGYKIGYIDKLYYQGSYEKDFIEKYKDKLNISNGISIDYCYQGKNKVYLSDFYIIDYDLVIEIKSYYWYKKNKELCDTKERYSKMKHNYIMVMDKDYKEFDKLIGILFKK